MDATPGEAGEFAAIERLRALLPGDSGDETWIGDDAAVVRPPTSQLLLAADALVEGVHFDLSISTLTDVGWKALAVNASDIAAMGGRCLHTLVTVAAPPSVDLDALYSGLVEAVEAFGCPVVGGDLSNGLQLVVTVAITGDITGPGHAVLRSGARPGDSVFVTGALGGASAGLEALREGNDIPHLSRAHRRPWPRIAEGEAARRAGATSMIDVSDGLAADIDHLATESNLRIALHAAPVARDADLEHALAGGDDYELVFTAPEPYIVFDRFAEAGLLEPIFIGHCDEGPPRVDFGGEKLDPLGWEHLWS